MTKVTPGGLFQSGRRVGSRVHKCPTWSQSDAIVNVENQLRTCCAGNLDGKVRADSGLGLALYCASQS